MSHGSESWLGSQYCHYLAVLDWVPPEANPEIKICFQVVNLAGDPKRTVGWWGVKQGREGG